MKKLLLLIVIVCYGATALRAQAVDIYQKYFPEPAHDMPLPIVSGKSDEDYYTSYKNVMEFIRQLAEKHPELMSVGSIGKTQKNKVQPMVQITRKSGMDDREKLRVVFIGCIHGNEPLATEGMLYFMYLLMQDQKYLPILDKVIIQIMPMVNADGRHAESRVSNNGVDLNRDLTILDAEESINIKTAINKFDPHVVVDFHEYSPARQDYKELNDCFTSSYDELFLYTGNLNVDPAIRDMIRNMFVEPTKKTVTEQGRRVTDYSTTFRVDDEVWLNIGGIASRSSATNYALQNRVSMLMEIRGLSEKEKAGKRRIETAAITALSYLQIAYENIGEIKATLTQADERAIAASSPSVATSKPEKIKKDYVFVNECTVSDTTITFNANYNISQTAVIARPKPEAFVVFPVSEKMKTVLSVSGVEFKEVTQPLQTKVQQYVEEKKGSIQLKDRDVTIPAGALVIGTHQRMSNVIADLIEPEGSNSMYTNHIIKKKSDEKEIPIYRVSKEQLLQLHTN
ncbi:M14 family zinc carboxypeptidase [Chitinophagaceae bacterium 26-R-25]|nr:M14 family zinc carboxypeptidase [Chitinophagaceae bacterium 26-R-25]